MRKFLRAIIYGRRECDLSLHGEEGGKYKPLVGTPSFPSSAFASAELASRGKEVSMMD